MKRTFDFSPAWPLRGGYPDEMTYALVGAASQRYSELMKAGGTTLLEFLTNLPDLHTRVTVSPQSEYFGTERLVDFVRVNSWMDPDRLLKSLCQEVDRFSAGAGPSDDLTCLMIRIGPNLLESIRGHREIELRSDLYELPLIRQLVSDMITAYFPQTDETDVYRLELAVNEAASNIMRHAYEGRTDGWIRLACETGSDWIRFHLYHSGIPQRADAFWKVEELEEPQEGGMGMYLITSCCDRVDVSTDALGRHCVSLLRRLPVTFWNSSSKSS